MIVESMGMVPTRQEGNRYRFAMPDAQAPGHLLDVVVGPSAPRGNPGGGTVHHIASRTRNSKEQAAWQQRLRHRGMAVTDVRDRRYFRTFYFHEPDGILFGIATDPPGFGVDENPRNLGAALKLPPPRVEPLHRQIESQLPPLESTVFHSRRKRSAACLAASSAC